MKLFIFFYFYFFLGEQPLIREGFAWQCGQGRFLSWPRFSQRRGRRRTHRPKVQLPSSPVRLWATRYFRKEERKEIILPSAKPLSPQQPGGHICIVIFCASFSLSVQSTQDLFMERCFCARALSAWHAALPLQTLWGPLRPPLSHSHLGTRFFYMGN